MDYIRKCRILEDEEVRSVIRQNYGPLLRISNVFPNLDEGRIGFSIVYTTICLITISTYLYLFCFTCYFIKDDFVLASIQFHYLLLAMFGTVFMLHLNKRRQTVCIIHKMMYKLYDYGDVDTSAEVKKELRKIGFKQRLFLIPLIVLIGIIGMFIVIIGPFIDSAVGATEKGSVYNGVYMKTPIPMYFPFPIDSPAMHYLVTTFQIVTVCILALSIGSVILVFVVLCQFAAYEMRLVITSIRNVLPRSAAVYAQRYPDRKLDWSCIYYDEEFQMCINYCLKQNIQHHQRIRGYISAIDELIQFPIFASFLMATVVMALSLIILVEKTDRVGLVVTNTLAMIGEVGNVYTACYFGEEMLTLGEELHETVYKIRWYLFNQKNKKLIISMQDSTLHPFLIKASLIFVCSMDTFSSICNTAYSYFNMLTASSKVSSKQSS